MKKNTLSIILILISMAYANAQSAGKAPMAENSVEQLEKSPRHGEWVTLKAEGEDSFSAWVVYPERSTPAPVVIVIHEIFGLNDWARAVADQFAAEGFIAIAPDFLSGKAPDGGGSTSPSLAPDKARELMGKLEKAEVFSRLDAASKYGSSLPASSGKTGMTGFCWGGGIVFDYAARPGKLDAAVVYYGVSPETSGIKNIRVPVLGLYGGDDNRVNSTIPAAEAEAKRLGKSYQVEIYPGAGHAFLRSQTAREANARAADAAWPLTIGFLEKTIGR